VFIASAVPKAKLAPVNVPVAKEAAATHVITKPIVLPLYNNPSTRAVLSGEPLLYTSKTTFLENALFFYRLIPPLS